MVKVKKNNRNFEVKKYIKKTTPALMSLLVATSCLNGVHYPKNAYASGVTQKIDTGDGGVKVLYANNGLNPLNFSIGDAAQYGNKNVEDVVKITVDFPKNHGKNDYGPESKKVNIKYEFNSNKGAYWSGRPFYWFSLPKNVKEPKNIKITNANGHSDSIQNWRQWSTSTRFVASRYQNMKDAINQNEGNPNDWGRFNDQTEEYQKGFNGSFNYQFNRMLDEQDGGWFDENGGTRNFAKSIRNNSKSIYIDWEPRGDGKVTIEVDTEVMFPLKSNTLDFAAGAFSVLGNIRIANMQTVTTPHYITYAEKFPLDTPEIMEVENPNNIGEEKKKEIIKKLKEEQKNKDKTKYLVEENNNFGYKQIEVKDNGDTTITFRDLSQQTIAGSRLVTKHVPYKDRFGIKIPQATSVKNTSKLEQNEINAVKEAIFDANKDNKEFIKGIGGEDKKDSAITVTEKGEATIKYVDGSSVKIEKEKLVSRYITLAEKHTPLITLPIGVKNKEKLEKDEIKKVKDSVWEANKDKLEKGYVDNGENSISVDEKGKATIQYKDGSKNTISSINLVYQIPPMNQLYEPNLIARLGSDNPTDLKEEEKKQLKEALWNANTNLHDKLKGKDKDKSITIEKDGTATFTYEDDTTDKIDGINLIYKNGQPSNPVTHLVDNGNVKYWITPIVVADINKLDNNNFADAARRFVFDNYDWDGKAIDYKTEKAKPFLTNGGGYAIAENGWPINKDNSKHLKNKAETKGINMSTGWNVDGVESIIHGNNNLEIKGVVRGFGGQLIASIDKNQLFITNGGAFDVDKAKKEADDIIDKLKNEKGLSKEEADKLKKEIEDAKGNGTLNQDKINEIIKKANEQAKKDSEAEKLKKAKDEAEKELKKLTDIKNEDKKDAENNIKQADTIDKVQKALDEAKKKDQEEKAKKEAEALLKKQKEEAKKVINSLNNLEKGEKEPYTKSNGSIDQAKDEKAIQDLVEKAKAQDKANADKKALDEAKKKAKDVIKKLQNLSDEEKKQFTEDSKGSVDKADTQEKVKEEIKKAQELDKQNKLKLDQAKNKAKEDIGKLKHLSPEERKQFNENIDKAKDQTAIDNEVKKAQEKDKQNAKSKAINDINNSGLTDEEKKQAEKEIEQAGSTDEIDKKAEEHLQKAAEEKAKKEKEEADKLKEEYKKELNKIKDIDEPTKKELEKRIDNANSKAELDSILQEAKAKAKQKQAKEEIAKLTHLNTAQIKDIQEKIDNLISDQDINEEVAKARYLDGKMDSLQKLVKKAGEADIQGRLAKAKDPEKTNFNNALEEAKKVEKKDGTYADDSTVSDLIKKLEDSINALDKTKAPVKAEVSKEALKKAIEDAKKLKDTDLYKNSDENKRKEFDEKLKEAETENTKQNSTDESVAKALQDLQNAQNALNGTFKLEKENGDALISVSDANDTEIKEDKDKEAIKAKIKGIPDGAVVTFSKIKDKKVTVTVVKDNVSKTIDVPVKGDVAAPTITVDGATGDKVEVTKMENFPELTVKATDDNLDESTLDVKPSVDWLEFDKNSKKIKLKSGQTSIPNTATNATITISVKDKAGNTATKTINVTVKSQSEKYSPEARLNGSVKKVVGESTDKAENYIKDKDKLPTGTNFKWKENNADTLTLDKVGKDQEKEITVTFPDGSEKEVKVKFNVVDTKPSAPTVAVLKNGDVAITPSADSDKVVVGYTPKDKDKETLVEATKDKGKWKLPEGFKEENGKIIIPDEITKNNTAVKVKASKGTSDYTTEVKQDLTKKSLLAPVPVVISGSDAKDTVLTKENADLIIATLTNAQTGGAKASIEKDAKIKEDADGSKYVEVTLTYDDNSKKVIKVKVVGDSTGPVFEGLGDASVKKYETFKPIEIKATDESSQLRDNEPYEVENLPSWLEFDKATNKVKLANALTRVPKEATTVKFKVKAYDKFNNVTEQEVTVTVNEAEEFTFEKPVIIKGKDKDKEKLSPEDEKTILDAVRGTNKLDGAEPSIVDKTIKVSGDESSVDVTLTYDDNQTRVINVKVEQDAKLKFGLHLPSEKVEVNDINNLNKAEEAKVLEKVKLANSDLKEKDGYTYSIVAVTGQDKKAGTVIVSKDGKVVGELPGERLVKERDITKYDVALPKVKVQVENKTNLKADEKEKVKEALENATDAKGVSNKDKFPKGTTLEVQSDGTVIISYPDKTIKTILGSDLVDGGAPYVKTIAEEVTPKVPDEKVKVVNPSSLDDKEIAEVKEKIKQANKDTFPANTTVEVAKDGTATITYKDGSSDTIKNTDLVEKAKEKLTDAKQNPAVKPNAKVEVEDSKKLTADEKAKVKENVKNTNPKAKDIVVGADGTVEITYPDGSENTIKPEDTVVQKAGKTPKESEAVKNPAKVPAVKVKVADTTKLTAEEIAKVKEEVTKVNPNATKVEVSSNGTATLTYKDGSENIVAGEKLVEQKAKGKTLAETVEILVPDVKTEVINPNRLSTAEKEKVKENLKAKNAGKLDSANITVQNNGTVTVEFADGSAKTIDGEKLVTKKADDGKLKPTIADLTDVDAPIYTKVAEYGKLTDSEKEAVKKAVIEANGGEDGKLKDADIKVLGDGTVVITYKDKSTDIIPADKTVNVGQSGSESLVQPALPEYPLDKLKPVADDFITEETQKIKDEINDSNIYSKEEKQKALAKIDEMVKKAKQKVQNAENDDTVLNTINEVLQDAKEFSKNIKENKLAEIAKAKAEAKAEIDKLANLTDEQKTSFKAEVDKAENLSAVKEVLDKAKVKDKEELAKAKAAGKAEIDKLVNLTDEQKSSFKKEADKAKTKADVKEVLDKAKAKDKEELDKAKAEAKSQIDKLANLTDEQKSSFKKDIQAGKDKNTVAKILDKAKEANKKVKGKAGAKEKAKGQSTLAKTGLNTTNTVGLGAIISLIVLALRRKFKK